MKLNLKKTLDKVNSGQVVNLPNGKSLSFAAGRVWVYDPITSQGTPIKDLKHLKEEIAPDSKA